VADTVIASTANSSMDDLPLWIQPSGGDPALSYTGIMDRTLLDGIFSAEGVLTPDAFSVSERGAGANFSVDVAAGSAVITGDSVANQGKYLVRSVGVVNVTTPAAPGSGTRIHRVIARIRDKSAAGSNYDWTLELLEDTGSGTPALPASAISLATVSITNGQASVLNTNITSQRPWARHSAVSQVTAWKTVNQTVNNSTTLVAATGMTWPVTAYARYAIDVTLIFTSGGTPDIKFGWTYPSGTNMAWALIGYGSDMTFGSMAVVNQTAVASPGGSALQAVKIIGTVVTDYIPGNLQLTFAQNVANASDTILQDSSWGILTRLVT
jgi:hypothetical protein